MDSTHTSDNTIKNISPLGGRGALLLSGGVDSAVVLHVLCSEGLKPDCFYIKIGPEEKEDWDCTSEEDLEMATALCQKYGCKLEIVDSKSMVASLKSWIVIRSIGIRLRNTLWIR